MTKTTIVYTRERVTLVLTLLIHVIHQSDSLDKNDISKINAIIQYRKSWTLCETLFRTNFLKNIKRDTIDGTRVLQPQIAYKLH